MSSFIPLRAQTQPPGQPAARKAHLRLVRAETAAVKPLRVAVSEQAPTPTPPPAPATPATAAEPRVSVERDGDRVKRIRVECPCGETIELDCEY